MANKSMRRFLGVALFSAIGGGMVGYMLGLLSAPERGDVIRRRLMYQLDVQLNRLLALLDRIGQEPCANEARESQEALIASAREEADQIKRDMDSLLDEIKGTKKR